MNAKNSDGPIVRLSRHAEIILIEYWAITLVALSGVTLTLAKDYLLKGDKNETIFDFSIRIFVLVFAIAMALLGAFGQYRRNGQIRLIKSDLIEAKKHNEKLQEIISQSELNYFEIWKIKLALLHSQLNLNGTFRVSLYRYSKQYGLFYMIGRYCKVEQHARRGRSVYSSDEGCIGRAWSSPEGEAFVDDLPITSHPDYLSRSCVDWGLEEQTVRSIRMKCRSIYALTIMDARLMDRIAVIVFESLDEKAGDMAAFRAAIQGDFGRELAATIDTLKRMEPSPDLAKMGGF